MNTDPPTREASCSTLLPDIDAETWADAQKLAAEFDEQMHGPMPEVNPNLAGMGHWELLEMREQGNAAAALEITRRQRLTKCVTADDVLLAGYLSSYGQTVIEHRADARTKAMRKLFADNHADPTGQRCLIGLAQELRKIYAGGRPIEELCLDFVTTLSAMLMAIAPDERRKFGRHPAG